MMLGFIHCNLEDCSELVNSPTRW